MLSRQQFIKGLLGTALVGLFGATYGFFIEPSLRLRVKRWKLQRTDWNAPPIRIVAISDLHVGEPFVTLSRVRQVVKRANALKPDLILLLGDYSASHRFVMKPVLIKDLAPELGKLEAKFGVYGILGNHDWWDDHAAQKRGGLPNIYFDALSQVGVTILSNQAVELPDAGIWLAGLEDQIALLRKGHATVGLDDLEGTVGQVTDTDAPVVMMAHEPDIFPKIPKRIALTFSGHTHGGQVRLWGWSPVVPSRYGNRYAYGHVQENDRDLIVSGGIGCSIAPVRFGMVPEITLVEMEQKT